ncbi:MAG: hypothetical protein AAF682_24625 [Planctomycetota bacterium]
METLRNLIDWLFEPTRYFLGSALLLFVVLKWRKLFSLPIFIYTFFVFGTLFFLWAMQDPDFTAIVTKPDNIPIVILLGSVGYFSWLALRQAVINDERTKRGEPTIEAELSRKKVFTWPDLVYTEFISLILFTAFLIAWSIEIPAPIEEPAELSRTPNPSKAPWYFLGLQELLVYFDAWIAGVLLPGFIIVGLCAIPYLDTNPKGNGYYTFDERPFAISFFWVGFILFWVSFVILGTFLRGPNWSFFGPFEYWDVHKLEPMVNVDLSTYFWVFLMKQPLPEAILLREAPGILLLSGYFAVLPVLLGKTALRGLYAQLGAVRYHVFFHMLLWFGLIPIKMLARWIFSLKYFVAIPEYFFNV